MAVYIIQLFFLVDSLYFEMYHQYDDTLCGHNLLLLQYLESENIELSDHFYCLV